jgi:hypothetical protein
MGQRLPASSHNAVACKQIKSPCPSARGPFVKLAGRDHRRTPAPAGAPHSRFPWAAWPCEDLWNLSSPSNCEPAAEARQAAASSVPMRGRIGGSSRRARFKPIWDRYERDRHKLGSHVDLPRWSVSPSQRRDRPCVGSSPTLPRGWGLRRLLAERKRFGRPTSRAPGFPPILAFGR